MDKCICWKKCKNSGTRKGVWICKCPMVFGIICKHNPRIKNYYKGKQK